MLPLSRTAKVGAFVAFAAALFSVIGDLAGNIVLLPAALIPFFAGIGILRRRAASAYGYAIAAGAQLLFLPLLYSRERDPAKTTSLILTAVLLVHLAFLFFVTGRSLAKDNTVRGSLIPWIVIAAVMTVPFIFVQAFIIPTGSMEATLLNGDRIYVQVFPHQTFEDGDLVALIYPPDRRQTFVKRIVGVAGDRLRFSGKTLYRDEVPLYEPYALHKSDFVDDYRDNFPNAPRPRAIYPGGIKMLFHSVRNGEVVVPQGKYFVLGDNRDYSLDSRYWGFADEHDLIGKPVLIYDSEEDRSKLSPNDKSRPHWPRTRWNRLFKPL